MSNNKSHVLILAQTHVGNTFGIIVLPEMYFVMCAIRTLYLLLKVLVCKYLSAVSIFIFLVVLVVAVLYLSICIVQHVKLQFKIWWPPWV